MTVIEVAGREYRTRPMTPEREARLEQIQRRLDLARAELEITAGLHRHALLAEEVRRLVADRAELALVGERGRSPWRPVYRALQGDPDAIERTLDQLSPILDIPTED